ncbi:hypothetical protein K450DRAFT_217528 [Umbelopsis ramanniana AG]|uniref:Uncharacterized protein n=1 Tax=Umbelopsis ramanniana AG TaxID=1314678 RepID=A0AAD5EJM5_UMBRA|nr:uncharacterized protein K450DRAFT_217528 [Umbelopsis ramanniana AG]KAI8584692.1 hypothetical protein K450DRAFT_217528 [Umbelopsis ramanniana AG]
MPGANSVRNTSGTFELVKFHNANMVILELLTIIPEDITTAQLIGGHRLQIMQELKDGLPHVISKLEGILSEHSHISQPEEYNINLKKKALKCFQSWVQYGISPEDAHSLLQKSVHLLTNDIYLEEVVDVLVEIMLLPKVTTWASIRQHLQDYIGSPWFMTRLSDSIRDEDDHTTRLLGRIAVTYGETFTETISDHMDQPGVLHLLELMMSLTTYPGYFGEDQEISEIPLNFWYVLQETLADKDWLPVTAEKHKQRNGLTNEVIWLDKGVENTYVVYQQLVLALRDKAMLPSEAEFTHWSKDVRDKFRIYRRDIADTLNSPYYVLHNDMILLLLQDIKMELLRQETMEYHEQRLEASFFALYSISDEIPPESSSEIAQLFEFNIFGQIPRNASPRLQNMALNCVGSFSEWLKNHPQYLLNVLNYIIPALSNAKLAQAAASSLKNVCDTCRAALVDGIDSLIALYQEVAQIGVEALIGDIVRNIQHTLSVVESDPITAAKNVQAQLQYLAACCRGLQSPNDDYQSLIARNAAYDMFASGSINTLYETVPGASELSQTINDTITQLVYLYSKDQETTQVLCQFLDAGLRSMSPLACLPLSTLLFIIQHSYESQPLTPWLDTASLVFTVYGGYDAHRDNLRQLLAVLTAKTLSGINNIHAMEEYPDVTYSYFSLLSRVIRRCPLILFQLPPDILNSIFSVAIAGMTLQERLALKAVMSFTAETVAIDAAEGTELRQFVDDLTLNIGYALTQNLLLGIGGRVPRSLMSYLIDVLYKLTGRYIEVSRHWLASLLHQDGFPSPHVTLQDKEVFMKGILGTRSAKRFKEVTTSFSVKCRKMDNTLFGSVV